MVITLKQLVTSSNSLAKLGSLLHVNPALKLRLARVLKQTMAELESFEKTRRKSLKELGVDVRQLTFSDHKAREEWEEGMEEISINHQVDIRFDTFSIEEFEKMELSPLDLVNLEWLFGGLENIPDGGDA